MKIHLQSGLEITADAFMKLAAICINDENVDTIQNASIAIGKAGCSWVIEENPDKKGTVRRRRL